jgi:hypothetical protein
MRDRNARHRSDDSILAVVKRALADREGSSAARIRLLMFTYPDRARAGQFLQMLVKTGEAVKVEARTPGARRPQERYFASAAFAAEWKSIPHEPHHGKTTKAMTAKRETPKKHRHVNCRALTVVKPQAKPAPTAPLATTAADFSRAKVTVCPSGLDHRHTFTGTPGRHVDSSQCRPWAAAAVGAV